MIICPKEYVELAVVPGNDTEYASHGFSSCCPGDKPAKLSVCGGDVFQ
jgi:hypothetical protein